MKKENLVEYLFFGAIVAFIIIAIVMAIKPDLGRPNIKDVMPKTIQSTD